MATRMLQRRGTAAEWAAANPILGDGELGYERDTLVVKLGDGVTAWNALRGGYVPRSVIDAAGDLIVGTADNEAGRLAKGTGLQSLRVNAAGTALEWGPESVTKNTVTASGDLIVGTGAAAVTRLGKGTTNQRLTTDASGNVVWADLPAGANPFVAIDAAGDLLVGSAADAVVRLAVGINGQILSVVAGTPSWQTPVSSSFGFAEVFLHGGS